MGHIVSYLIVKWSRLGERPCAINNPSVDDDENSKDATLGAVSFGFVAVRLSSSQVEVEAKSGEQAQRTLSNLFKAYDPPKTQGNSMLNDDPAHSGYSEEKTEMMLPRASSRSHTACSPL
jgi:hypothetical protein